MRRRKGMHEQTTAQEIVKQLNIIDDTLFQKMAEDPGFCEEVISTILMQKVTVIKVTPQNSVKNLQGRSVVLDALCELENGEKCNVEVQKANDDDLALLQTLLIPGQNLRMFPT